MRMDLQRLQRDYHQVKRLNSAGDDAAGAAIVNRMSSQIAGMNVAIRNAGDAISMSQVAEGALHEVFRNFAKNA